MRQDDHAQKEVIQKFKQVVNMTANELEDWLNTEDSKQVGQKDGDNESIGHKSAKNIIKLLQKHDYDEDDFAHMQKVISYVKRHSAQRPSGDVKSARWRFSLMNWGHDPLKKA